MLVECCDEFGSLGQVNMFSKKSSESFKTDTLAKTFEMGIVHVFVSLPSSTVAIFLLFSMPFIKIASFQAQGLSNRKSVALKIGLATKLIKYFVRDLPKALNSTAQTQSMNQETILDNLKLG